MVRRGVGEDGLVLVSVVAEAGAEALGAGVAGLGDVKTICCGRRSRPEGGARDTP